MSPEMKSVNRKAYSLTGLLSLVGGLYFTLFSVANYIVGSLVFHSENQKVLAQVYMTKSGHVRKDNGQMGGVVNGDLAPEHPKKAGPYFDFMKEPIVNSTAGFVSN